MRRTVRLLCAALVAVALTAGLSPAVSAVFAADPVTPTAVLDLDPSQPALGQIVDADVSVRIPAAGGGTQPVAGAAVRYERSRDSQTWVNLGTVATGSDGVAHGRVLMPLGTWRFRAVVAATATTTTATSNTVQVSATGTSLQLALATTTAGYGGYVAASVTVTRSTNGTTVVPVAGLLVRLERSANGQSWTVLGSARTDSSGVARSSVWTPLGAWKFRAVAAEPTTEPSPPSNVVTLTGVAATTKLSIWSGATVRSESVATLTYSIWSPTLPKGTPLRLAVYRRPLGGSWWLASYITGRVGVAERMSIAPWRREDVILATPGSPWVKRTYSNVVALVTTPYGAVMKPYPGRPEPRTVFGPQPAPVGAGANAVVTGIPDAVWKRMYGVSWQSGCPLGRSSLRYITVNYYGFDGYRHRGEMVTSSASASRAAAVLTSLYALRYPIRQMRLVDDFGRGPYRGANDYASMKADNTSAFNCRYVVGREPQRVLSPHAYGGSIDINPWENPYVARTGVFPNSAWLPRSTNHPAVLNTSKDYAVRAFAAQGYAWGGAYRDYHHFQRSGGDAGAVPFETHGQPFGTWPDD
jgi:hypothetical protein